MSSFTPKRGAREQVLGLGYMTLGQSSTTLSRRHLA
jgi:hypothetical protein